MAPPGKHYMSVFVQYAPPKLATGEWTDKDREGFGKTVIDQLENTVQTLRTSLFMQKSDHLRILKMKSV